MAYSVIALTAFGFAAPLASRADPTVAMPMMSPLDTGGLAGSFVLAPAYRPATATPAGVHVIGGYAIGLPPGEMLADANAPGWLPIDISTSAQRCFHVAADLIDGALRNPSIAPAPCPIAGGREAVPPPPRPGLRFIGTSWSYSAWVDDRAGVTIIARQRGASWQTLLTAKMRAVRVLAMDSPDAPLSNLSFIGEAAGKSVVLIVRILF